MTWFEDLSPYTYCENVWTPPGTAAAPTAVNVGWLDGVHPFATADPRPELVEALLRLCRKRVNVMRVMHRCELCAEPELGIVEQIDGETIHLGNTEIRVIAADGTLYAAPTLIAHYVAEHHYLPPTAFVTAAMDLNVSILNRRR